MKKLKISIVFATLLILLSTSSAFSQPSLFSSNKFVSSQHDTLLYRMLFPDYDTMRRYPLVVFLHGSGERGHDNEAQLKWGVMNFATDYNMKMHPAIVIAPQCPDTLRWSNFSNGLSQGDMKLLPAPSRPMNALIELIHDAMKRFKVDSTRIYITGLSMGGYGTFDAIMRYPHLFAAAVPVCGGGDVSKAPQIAHIPMWIFTGAEDPAVTPVLSVKMAQALMQAGGHPGLTQYPETGHFSWIAAYSDAMMMEWLFRQHL